MSKEENIIIIIGVIFLSVFLFFTNKRNKRLRSAGEIAIRKRTYVEEAEEFILLLPDSSSVAKKLQQLPYTEMKVSMSSSDGEIFYFSCARWGWKARLFLKGTEEDKRIYCFQFLEWKTNGGIPFGELYMNKLLTAVEKMFLDLDPQTQVETRLLETKTSHRF